METEEKKKQIPKRLFASCPVCGNIIIQAEYIKNALIKCERCHNMITVEIEGNKIITLAPMVKQL